MKLLIEVDVNMTKNVEESVSWHYSDGSREKFVKRHREFFRLSTVADICGNQMPLTRLKKSDDPLVSLARYVYDQRPGLDLRQGYGFKEMWRAILTRFDMDEFGPLLEAAGERVDLVVSHDNDGNNWFLNGVGVVFHGKELDLKQDLVGSFKTSWHKAQNYLSNINMVMIIQLQNRLRGIEVNERCFGDIVSMAGVAAVGWGRGNILLRRKMIAQEREIYQKLNYPQHEMAADFIV